MCEGKSQAHNRQLMLGFLLSLLLKGFVNSYCSQSYMLCHGNVKYAESQDSFHKTLLGLRRSWWCRNLALQPLTSWEETLSSGGEGSSASSSERSGDVVEIISDLLLPSTFSVPGFPRSIKLAFVGAGEGVQWLSFVHPIPCVSFYPIPETPLIGSSSSPFRHQELRCRPPPLEEMNFPLQTTSDHSSSPARLTSYSMNLHSQRTWWVVDITKENLNHLIFVFLEASSKFRVIGHWEKKSISSITFRICFYIYFFQPLFLRLKQSIYEFAKLHFLKNLTRPCVMNSWPHRQGYGAQVSGGGQNCAGGAGGTGAMHACGTPYLSGGSLRPPQSPSEVLWGQQSRMTCPISQ